MLLKNKKTGEIIEVLAKISFIKRNDNFIDNEINTFDSLAKLNEEWEDYEKPKNNKMFWIDYDGEVVEDTTITPFDTDIKQLKKIGNYFETKEEAERAVEKLKAWKRLEDKGFKLDAVTEPFFCLDIYMSGKEYKVLKHDLEIVFGGENGKNK